MDHFPWKDWSRLTAQVLRERPADALHYGDPRGELTLRSAIAEYLGMARGISCTPDQIIIVSSSKHAVEMAARLLGAPGDEVWLEEPGHPVCRHLLGSAGLVPVSVPVDLKGMDISEARQRAPNAPLALISPSYQYAVGVTMTLDRRLEMLQWADRTSAWIIEDDHDGEYRYWGRPVAPLFTLDRTGRVIYIGSFSNLLAPGLRMGYMVVPSGLVRGFLEMGASLVPIFTQLVAAAFRQQRPVVVASSANAQGPQPAPQPAGRGYRAARRGRAEVGAAPEAGVRLLARLVVPCDDQADFRRAVEAGIHVHRYRVATPDPTEVGFIARFRLHRRSRNRTRRPAAYRRLCARSHNAWSGQMPRNWRYHPQPLFGLPMRNIGLEMNMVRISVRQVCWPRRYRRGCWLSRGLRSARSQAAPAGYLRSAEPDESVFLPPPHRTSRLPARRTS